MYVSPITLVSKAMEAEHALKQLITLADIEKMNEKEFECLKTLFGFFDAAIEMTVNQAHAINEINDKLDRLIKVTTERES